MSGMTKKRIEKMATEIRSFLLNYDLWVDVRIYFNGKCFATDDAQGHYFYNDPNNLVVLEDMDPHRFMDYVGDVLTMSFEGDFYEVINYGIAPKILERFDKIIEKYGCHYELGNAWNLGVYQD